MSPYEDAIVSINRFKKDRSKSEKTKVQSIDLASVSASSESILDS